MSENHDKSEFVPADQRRDDSSALGADSLATLDRLVAKGEFLLHPDLTFSQADELLRKGYAEKAGPYGPLEVIRPTAKGREVAKIREEMLKANALRPALPKRKDPPS
jgi:hypothetical protein